MGQTRIDRILSSSILHFLLEALTWVPALEARLQLPVFDAIRKTILKAHRIARLQAHGSNSLLFPKRRLSASIPLGRML